MPVFGSGREPQQRVPVDMIRTMRAQGLDNNQIIQSLQRDGYSSTEIFDAMNQADMPSMAQESSDDSMDSPPMPEPQQAPRFTPSTSFSRPQGASMGDSSSEELIEAIIDEKWNALEKDISKVIEWKNAANNKIVSLEQRFSDLKQEFDKLHSALISKIDEYDKNITNVGAEVRAMEKVFSKVLPVFTENVAELSRITKDVKKSKKAQ